MGQRLPNLKTEIASNINVWSDVTDLLGVALYFSAVGDEFQMSLEVASEVRQAGPPSIFLDDSKNRGWDRVGTALGLSPILGARR